MRSCATPVPAVKLIAADVTPAWPSSSHRYLRTFAVWLMADTHQLIDSNCIKHNKQLGDRLTHLLHSIAWGSPDVPVEVQHGLKALNDAEHSWCTRCSVVMPSEATAEPVLAVDEVAG